MIAALELAMITKNPHVNWTGMKAFIGCMAFSTVFFIYVLAFQPGPVDQQVVPEIGLTKTQYIERKEIWIKSTPESIQRGEKSYKLNLAFFYQEGGKDTFLEMFKSGELPNKGTELEVFRMISKGNEDQGIMKVDHIREDERWDIVHYLRSLNPNLPATSNSEWKQFFKEGA